MLTYQDFINESRLTVKRKYTDKHPEKRVYSNAPVREKILSFVKESGKVSQKDLLEYIKGMNEGEGRKTTIKWVNNNLRYFRVTEKNGTRFFRLSLLGERVHTAILKQIS